MKRGSPTGKILAAAIYILPADHAQTECAIPAANSPQFRQLASGIFRLLLIILAVAAVTGIRYWLGVSYGAKPTFIIYFPLVVAVAVWWGPAAGLWATLFCGLAADYFFLLPRHSFYIAAVGDRIGIVVLFIASIAISLTAGSLRRVAAEQKLAAHRLRAAEERLELERRGFSEAKHRLADIVDFSDDAMMTMDMMGVVITWNAGAERVFGYTSGEAIGRSIQFVIPPGRENEPQEVYTQLLHAGGIRQFDTVRLTKSGKLINVSMTVAPLRDSDGKVIGASGIVRDITEVRNIERQLRHSQKMDAVGQLTGGIAHDFNNLLAIIISSLEVQEPLLQDLPAALKCCSRAHSAALRGADLIRRLLAFSSADQSHSTQVHLAASIRNIVALARPTIGPQIKTSLNLDENMPPVRVDAGSLESSILNLILNARDAMPDGGTLNVSAAIRGLDLTYASVLNPVMTAGPYACISVTDTGTGMTQEVLDRAFEPFFTTKARGRGTGLGLAAVYGFARQSKGGANIYSEPGRGTTITIYLPFAEQPSALGAVDEDPHTSLAGHGTILIVDDELDLLDVATEYLDGLGYQTLRAHDGPTALVVLKSHSHIEVVITDLIMGGGMDGVELGRQINQLRPDVRIIYSSGFSADSLTARGLPLAESLILQKPYRLAELGTIVQQAMKQA